MLSPRPTSERRAAAARANGAKSRGPVTAQGIANSARNSLRHGLRSEALFTDPASEAERIAILDHFMGAHRPQSPTQHAVIKDVAHFHWLITCVRKLENSIMERETRRLHALMPDENPDTIRTLAFRALADDSCALHLLNRLESRFDRQLRRAVRRFLELRANPHAVVESANQPNPKKTIVYERTQQLVENTTTAHRDNPARASQPAHPESQVLISHAQSPLL